MDEDTGDDTEASRDVQLDKAKAMYIALKPYLLLFLNSFLFTEDKTAVYHYMTSIGQWTMDEFNERLDDPGSYVHALRHVALQNGGEYETIYKAHKFTNKITGGDNTLGMDESSDSDDLLASDDEEFEDAGGDERGALARFIGRCLII